MKLVVVIVGCTFNTCIKVGCFSQKYLTLGNFSIFNSLDIQVCLEFLTWRWSMKSKRKRSWLTMSTWRFFLFLFFFLQIKMELTFLYCWVSFCRSIEACSANSWVQSVDRLESIHQGNQLEINKTVQNQAGPSLRGKSSPSTNLAGTTTGREGALAGAQPPNPTRERGASFLSTSNGSCSRETGLT